MTIRTVHAAADPCRVRGARRRASPAPSSAPPARCRSQSPPAPGTPKNFVVPAPARSTLPNGLAVSMVPFGQVPKVTIQLVVQAGNTFEQANEVWLADLTGRMLQEGTESQDR